MAVKTSSLPDNIRTGFMRSRKGDLLGGDFKIPKGDFANFLSYRKPSAAEATGQKKVTAERVLEMALHKRFSELGERAAHNSQKYHNIDYGSIGDRANEPGQGAETVKDGLVAVQKALEVGGMSNMAYLEMQYEFQFAARRWSLVSNLMKARSESVKKSINEVR